jgi:hypothetical protein
VVPVQADEVAEVFEKVTGGFFFVCFGDATDLAAREGMNGWMKKKWGKVGERRVCQRVYGRPAVVRSETSRSRSKRE